MARSRRSAAGVSVLISSGSHQHVADLLARIERAVGVLENDLHLAAQFRRHRAVGDVDLDAVDEQFARCRRVDQRDDAGERRLAAAAFADDRQRLALLDREVDALHGMHGARLGKQAAADMVVAHDVAAFEDDFAHTPTPGTVSSSSTKPFMVGKRSPTAFSGSADSSSARIGVLRRLEQRQHVGLLHLAAPVLDDDAVGRLGDHAHIVGDHDQAHAVPGLQADQQIEDLLLDRHVERGGRLVGDQQLGIAGDRHGDHDALALAARHLVRVGFQPLLRLGNADRLEAVRWRGRAALPGRARDGSAAPPRSGSRR